LGFAAGLDTRLLRIVPSWLLSASGNGTCDCPVHVCGMSAIGGVWRCEDRICITYVMFNEPRRALHFIITAFRGIVVLENPLFPAYITYVASWGVMMEHVSFSRWYGFMCHDHHSNEPPLPYSPHLVLHYSVVTNSSLPPSHLPHIPPALSPLHREIPYTP
jgi:hypothetical protein